MTDAGTIARMLSVFKEVFGDDTLTINASTTAADIEDWDSLSNVRLMVAMEGAFGVRFKASEMAQLENVGELADLIERKLG